MNLAHLAKELQELEAKTHQNPLDFVSFTACQERFLRCTDKLFLLRGGNQIGKTFIGSCEMIFRCLGRHPYKKVPAPPIEAWVVCHSYSQSLIIQEKIWDLLPKQELMPDVEFVRGKGFRGSGSPVIRFSNGSLVRLRTTGQASAGTGTISMSSGTIDYVWIDEPPGPRVWSELVARIARKRGSLSVTMTPVGVPVDYLREMVEAGQVTDIHAPMSLANVTPAGCRPLLSAEEIESLGSSYLKFDRAVRMEGSWEGYTPDGVIFEEFRDELISDLAPPDGDWRFVVGIDHGSAAGAQFAILAGVLIPDPNKPKDDKNNYYVYILDEYCSSGAQADVHARGILSMIHRNGLKHTDIHRWTGDRSHRGDRYGGRMSNTMLRSAFEHVLKYPRGRGFRIHTAYKPAYSVYYGCRVLHDLMAKARFQINPKCSTTIKSLKNWAVLKTGRMDVNSEHKHSIDSLRYAVMCMLEPSYALPKAGKIKLVRK